VGGNRGGKGGRGVSMEPRSLSESEGGGGVALYAYNTTRTMKAMLMTSLEVNDRSVADLLSTNVSSNADFSLDVVFTTLPFELEQACRSAVIVALSKGCVYSGCGNVLKLNGIPGAAPVVYFCMVRDLSPPKDKQKIADGEEGVGDAAAAALDTSYYASDHVVCFVAEPLKQNDELELFRPELDAFCGQLARDGVLGAFDPSSIRSRQMLMSWRARTMEYLSWCITSIGDRTADVVQAALLGQDIEVVGGTADQAGDIQRFCIDVSPRSLLHYPADSLRPLLSGEGAAYIAPPPKAILTLDDSGILVSADGLARTTSNFCKQWAEAMVSAAMDTTAVKMILQNNGRKVIQEVNRIKWLLGMAESNHYALYNARRYLTKCGTPPRALLQHVVDTIEAGSSAHALDVVTVLIQAQLLL